MAISPAVGAALIGAGGGLLSGGKGKKGGGPSLGGIENILQRQQGIAEQHYANIDPLAQILFRGTPAQVTGGLPGNYGARLDEINNILNSGFILEELEERERSED